MNDERVPSEPKRSDLSLRASALGLIGLMPEPTQRRVRAAVVLSVGLAFLEFAAVILLYPVFGFLSQQNAASFQIPILGIELDRSWARLLAVVALALMIARSVLTLVYRYWWLNVTARAERELSDRLMNAYAFAPYSFHLRTRSSDLMARAVSHISLACQSGLVGIVGAISSGLLAFALALALVAANPVAGVSIAAYVGLLAVVYTRLSHRRTKRLISELESRIAIVYGRIGTLLRGIREITIFGQRQEYLQSISDSRDEMVSANANVTLLQDIPRAVLEVTLYATVLVVLSVLLSAEDAGQALPLVALYVIAGLRIVPSLGQMLGSLASARTGAQIGIGIADDLVALGGQPSPTPGLTGAELPVQPASLTLDDVSFRYEVGAEEVLSGVTFSAEFGALVGVVGPSGSGKTTLTSIILGLLAPTSGTICYGDFPVVASDAKWFARVAVVPQDVFLTDGTLLENIVAGSPVVGQRVSDALTLSGLDPLVELLPGGVDTPLLEGGVRLSAGQRQRVGLARAIYRNPSILVLDEPTSALDAETETHIVRSIEGLRGRMTIFVVAHRTHTLANADVVIRLTDGAISEIGTPFEVLGQAPVD